MQNALLQDAAAQPSLLRLVTIDIASGQTTHEYAYLLTKGTGVSEITALNQHEFLVDERDGHGRGDGSKAKVKQIFKIDLNGAVDVTTHGRSHGSRPRCHQKHDALPRYRHCVGLQTVLPLTRFRPSWKA